MDGGAEFTSETDAEVVAHLIAHHVTRKRRPWRLSGTAYNQPRGSLRLRRDARPMSRMSSSPCAKECPLDRRSRRGRGQFPRVGHSAFLRESAGT